MLPSAIHVLVPFWGFAGGVVKILDYAEHSTSLGVPTTLWAPNIPESGHPIYELPVAARLLRDDRVAVRPLDDLSFEQVPHPPDTTVVFTEPTHHRLIEACTSQPLGSRLIHLVQGIRHADPAWQDGTNYRLLHRPMTRIAVSEQVANAIAPLVNSRFACHTIVEGHDWGYFTGRPAAAPSPSAPLRVLYATWKSDLGDRVAQHLADDPRVAFIAIRTPLGWPALRNRYHGADVLLCTPLPEEGFYLPGVEAMGAGLAVVTARVGGNDAYIHAGHNALIANFDDVASHADAITRLADDPELRQQLTAAGQQTVESHTLERERGEFADVLHSLDA